mmetsp:Transcript_29652/g.36088  ORF Transcript_29652/g.36088 Transcript_29652/m.36088 type:complete len:248 (-) Transcript_29652:68-811(-)
MAMTAVVTEEWRRYWDVRERRWVRTSEPTDWGERRWVRVLVVVEASAEGRMAEENAPAEGREPWPSSSGRGIWTWKSGDVLLDTMGTGTSVRKSSTAGCRYSRPMMRLAWYTVEWGWLSIRSFAAAPTTWDGMRDRLWPPPPGVKDTTEGIMGDAVNGSGMQSIRPTPLEGVWTQMTELVVPRSIPATVARPRKPSLAMRARDPTARPMREGRMVMMWSWMVFSSFLILRGFRLWGGCGCCCCLTGG